MRINPFSGSTGPAPGKDRSIEERFQKLLDGLKSKDRAPELASTMALGEEGPMPIEPGIGDDKPLPISDPQPQPIGSCPPPAPEPIAGPRPRPGITTMAIGEEGDGPTVSSPSGGNGIKGPFMIDDPAPRDTDRSSKANGVSRGK